MTHAVVTYLPWLLSVVTIYAMWLAGKKRRLAWSVSLCNQVLWLIYIVAAGAWGLIPMNLALWLVFAHNYRKWNDL